MRLQLILAARYLWGRKLRTALTTLAVVFATLVIFGMNTLMPTMLAAFQGSVQAASGQVDVTVTQQTGEIFAPTLANKVRALPGVRLAAGLLSRTVNIPAGFYPRAGDGASGVQVSAITLTGIDPHAAQELHNYQVEQGRFLRVDDSNAVVIAASLAEAVGLKVGDTLRVPATQGAAKLRVIGILPARTLPGNEEVLVTLAEAQKLLDAAGRINTIEASLSTVDTARRTAITKAIESALGPDYQLGGLASGSDLLASLQTGQAVFNLFGFLALFMGGFIIFNTFRTVVVERRHDIGLLRAIGAGRGTIAGLFLIEGLLQGVVGTACGILLGYLMAAGIVGGMASIWQQYLHTRLGSPVVSPGLFAMTAGLGIGVTLVAGLMPALAASRLTPLEALRPAAEIEVRRAGAGTFVGVALLVLAALALISGNLGLAGLGALLFLIGLLLVAPIVVRPLASTLAVAVGIVYGRDGTGMLAEGNLQRQPGRAATTASATMIGLAIIITAAGAMTSLNGLLGNILATAMGSDYMLVPPAVGVWGSDVGADKGLADKLRAIPGVGAVSTMRYASSRAGGKEAAVMGIDPAVFPQVSGLNFQAGDSQAAYAALAEGRALIANGILAAQAGLKPGDTVRLSTPSGAKDYLVAAIAGDYFNLKITTLYLSQKNLQIDFHKTEDVYIQLNLAPGANRETVEPRLRALLANYPQFQLISSKTYTDQAMQQVQAALAVMYVMLAVLAVPSLIALLNTLAIGVIERTREIGMLRAIGATRPQVRRMIVAEALLLAGIGTLFGLVGGLYLSYVSVLGLSASGYPMSFIFPTGGLIAATLIGLAFGALAALVPARQAAGLEIIRALQYE